MFEFFSESRIIVLLGPLEREFSFHVAKGIKPRIYFLESFFKSVHKKTVMIFFLPVKLKEKRHSNDINTVTM